MKNTVLFFVVAALCGPVWGQTVDGVNLAEKKEIDYLKVLFWDAGKIGKTRYRITVDYGQQPGGKQNFTILDDAGNPREWVSDMEVLNYFASLGWELMYQYRPPAAALDAFVFKRKA